MHTVKNILQNKKLMWLWGLCVSALFGYAMYSFRYEFLDWSNLPLVGFYAVLGGVCFALAFLMLWAQMKERGKVRAFFAAFTVFQVILWTVLTLVNVEGRYNRRAVSVAFAVLFIMYAAIMLLAFRRLGRTLYKPMHRTLAVVLCLGFLFAAALPVLPSPEEVGKKLRFTSDISFSPVSAEKLRVTENEVNTARAWFETHVLFAGKNHPAYDFKLDGEPFSSHTKEWDYAVSGPVPDGRGGEAYTVTAKHRTNGLTLRIEGAFYEKHASLSYTVYIKNEGGADSPVITAFDALTGISDVLFENASLYCSGGSHNAADDFTLYRAKNVKKPLVFSGTAGRSSDEYMPYFNLCGDSVGVVLGVGWTGQWQASISVKDGSASFGVRQQTLEAYLTPGEEIRSPLVSLSFYEGGNPVKGFNAFRDWVLDCVYPENTPYVLNDLDVLYVSHTRTAAEIVNDVNGWDDALLGKVDNFWMDAGWYEGCIDGWGDGNGNWVTNAERFPKGIKEISELAEQKGAGLVLWYEPERLVHGSALYAVGQSHPQYIIDPDSGDERNTQILWNLADDGACDYLTAYIADSLKKNGVSVYRQDFNIEPLGFWEYADANYYGGRTGICENHYVTNLYRYLDGLFAAVPGLVMDNCASGGRRLDLEMTRRSIPLWRSDYNCAVYPDSNEATQAHTYGLSFWLPVSGVNVDFSSEYGARSSVFGGNVFTYDSCLTPYFGMYDAERALLVKSFYPISFGGVKKTGVTAMQYGDGAQGMALVYHHEKAKTGAYAVPLSGLNETGTYKVWDADAPDAAVTLTGAELMRGAFTVNLPAGKKAVIVKYAVA